MGVRRWDATDTGAHTISIKWDREQVCMQALQSNQKALAPNKIEIIERKEGWNPQVPGLANEVACGWHDCHG